ncbi:MAG: hypothetical protein RL065_1813, partial [Bacteroidota bacterium]
MKFYGKNLNIILTTFVFLVTAFVLIRWQIHKPVFYIGGIRFGRMNPIVATCLIISSLLNFCIIFKVKYATLIVRVGGIFLLIVAILKTITLFSSIEFYVDKTLFGNQFDVSAFRHPNHGMSNYALINILIFSINYILYYTESKKRKNVIVILLIIAFFNSLLNLLYHVFNATELTKVFGFYPMVSHAAICSMILSAVSLLLNHEYGIMRYFSSSFLGGRFSRVLSPLILVVPITFGYLKYYLTKEYNLSDEFGLVILIIILIILFYAITNYLSHKLNQIHESQTEFEQNYFNQLKTEINTRTNELRINESKFESVINQYPHPILMVDINGYLINSNPSWKSEFNFKSNDSILYNVLQDENLKKIDIKQKIEKVKAGEIFTIASFSINQFDTPDTEKWFEILMYPFKDLQNSVTGIILFFEDLTAIKKVEQSLAVNQKKYQALIENSTDITVLLNKDAELIYISPSFKKLLGYTLDEIENINVFKLLHAETMDETLEEFSLILQRPGEVFPSTQRILCKDGNYIWGQGTVINLLNDPNVNAIVANYRDITGNKELENEIIKLNKYLEVKIKIRTKELEKANNELKMFTYSVSHDLRTPLAAIDGFATFIDEFHKNDLNDEVKESVIHIMNSAKRMNSIINDLLNLSKVGKVELSKTDVSIQCLINKVISDYKNSNLNAPEIKVNDMKVSCKVDDSLMQQVWMNLISNAVK